MTATLPVRGFGLQGVVRDAQPWDVPMQGLTVANNARIEDGAIGTFGRTKALLGPFTEDGGATEITAAYGAPFWIDGGDVNVLVMSNGEVRVYDDLIGYTVVGTVTAPVNPVYSTQLDDIFIITSLDFDPQVLYAADIGSPTGLTPMPGWPAGYRAEVMEVYRNFLVALRVTVAGSLQGSLVKWSHPYQQGDTTFDWDPTSTTNLAGEQPLASGGQAIVAGGLVRDALMIYFGKSTWRMDFVGAPFVFNFRLAFTNDGCIGPYGHTIAHDRALVVGQRDIYMHDGVSKQSISDGRNTRWFYQQVDVTDRVYVAYYPLRNEVYIAFRTGEDSSAADRILIYNTIHNAWTDLRTGPGEQLGEVNGLFLGAAMLEASPTYDDWLASNVTYEELGETTYLSLLTANRQTAFFALDPVDRELVDMDDSSGIAASRVAGLLEHAGIDFDELLGGAVGNRVVYLSRVYPQIQGVGEVYFRFGAGMRPGEIKWAPQQLFDLSKDYKVDTRLAGRYLAIRVRPKDDASYRLSGFDVEIAPVGEK